MPKKDKNFPTEKDKQLVKDYKKLNGRQRHIVKGMLKNSDDWLELRTLLETGQVNTEKRYKRINKFKPQLTPLENYQLIVDHVTAHIRHWGTLGDTR